jgi:hypothetical protein
LYASYWFEANQQTDAYNIKKEKKKRSQYNDNQSTEIAVGAAPKMSSILNSPKIRDYI